MGLLDFLTPKKDETPVVNQSVQSKYSDRFDKFIDFTLKSETEYQRGHYGDYNYAVTEYDKSDDGNWLNGKLLGTKWGIDARSYGADPSNLTLEDAKGIYYKDYWVKNKCEDLPEKLGECHFDCAVNTGTSRANKFLAACNNDPKKYNDLREDFYHRLADSKEKYKKFEEGWVSRVRLLDKFLGLV